MYFLEDLFCFVIFVFNVNFINVESITKQMRKKLNCDWNYFTISLPFQVGTVNSSHNTRQQKITIKQRKCISILFQRVILQKANQIQKRTMTAVSNITKNKINTTSERTNYMSKKYSHDEKKIDRSYILLPKQCTYK